MPSVVPPISCIVLPAADFGQFVLLSPKAILLTTEHLKSLGRVEKRTLFVKPITEVFKNEFVLANVLSTAEKAVEKNEPFLVTQMSQEDKWHVLTTCTNQLSSCFAPYHVFFNEARRVESYYQSAWYVFTLTCAQTEASGRWFITPLKPVGKDDVGMLRIRIVMMNEQELREIASGAIEPPSFGFFNGRAPQAFPGLSCKGRCTCCIRGPWPCSPAGATKADGRLASVLRSSLSDS